MQPSYPPNPSARQDAPCPRQGRSERGGEAYSVPYVERLSDARTPLADFFRILLDSRRSPHRPVLNAHRIRSNASRARLLTV
jgi:hypothetical protein